jgi:hypothetical protein
VTLQSRGIRIGLVVLAGAIAVGLFVLLSGGDDDSDAPGEAATQTTQAAGETQPAGGGSEQAKPQKPKPEIPTIEVKGGEPVGGVQELSFEAGGTIEFRVTSDAPAEVHFHGYDVSMDVSPDKPVTFDVPADSEGVFEVELEETAVQIAEVEVTPG